MSRLDFCEYWLVNDCYDWKNDNCDECNIFKAYCEGARRAKNSIVRCKDCKFSHKDENGNLFCLLWGARNFYHAIATTEEESFCSHGERREDGKISNT